MQPSHFIIRTDHFSLKFLRDQRITTAIQHKGISKLMALSYQIQYRKGVENVVADALSRRVNDIEECNGLIVVQPKWITYIIESY